jgi:hypothetical protein
VLHDLAGLCDSRVPLSKTLSHFNSTVPNLDVSNSVVNTHFNSTVNTIDVSANVWHSRLGHLSDSRMQLLHNVLPGCTSISNKTCFVCPLAKQHRLPFSTS